MTLNFHLFLTPKPFTYRSYFSLDKRFGSVIGIKIFLFEKHSVCKSFYYMISCVSGQDEPNCAL